LIQGGRLLGVLDLDSPQMARFDQEDADGLAGAADLLLRSDFTQMVDTSDGGG
jgi:L-methionine (R)-S-oxide reductase